MKRYLLPLIVILVIAAVSVIFLYQRNADRNKPIGGDFDSHGCLIPAGYSFDDQVGACTRAFELTPDIRRAAQLAVEKVGRAYALTVVSFNSYEEIGSYDITLEIGSENKKQTVYIRNWRVVAKP